jgi:hypothetical protein
LQGGSVGKFTLGIFIQFFEFSSRAATYGEGITEKTSSKKTMSCTLIDKHQGIAERFTGKHGALQIQNKMELSPK